MTWISDALGALKLPPKVIAGVAIPAAVLALSPNSWIERLGLDGFMGFARPYVSLVFITSLSILLVEFVIYLNGHITNRLRRRKAVAKLIERIGSLDPAERIVLREFFIQGQTTVRLPLDHPVVAGLIQKGIIHQVGQFGESMGAGMTFSFRVPDEVLPMVNRDLLGLPANPTEEDKKRILAERPRFIIAIQQHDQLFQSPW